MYLYNKFIEDCDCEKCNHVSVCKYYGDVTTIKKAMERINEPAFPKPIKINMTCDKFDESNPNIKNAYMHINVNEKRGFTDEDE